MALPGRNGRRRASARSRGFARPWPDPAPLPRRAANSANRHESAADTGAQSAATGRSVLSARGPVEHPLQPDCWLWKRCTFGRRSSSPTPGAFTHARSHSTGPSGDAENGCRVYPPPPRRSVPPRRREQGRGGAGRQRRRNACREDPPLPSARGAVVRGCHESGEPGRAPSPRGVGACRSPAVPRRTCTRARSERARPAAGACAAQAPARGRGDPEHARAAGRGPAAAAGAPLERNSAHLQTWFVGPIAMAASRTGDPLRAGSRPGHPIMRRSHEHGVSGFLGRRRRFLRQQRSCPPRSE